MPSVTSAISSLVTVGPLLDLQVAVPPQLEQWLIQQNQAVPGPVAASMMIDTGASNTVIKTGIAQQLGLQPVGVIQINTPQSQKAGQPFVCNQYFVRLLLPNGVATVIATEAPLHGQTIHGLIGRDLLQHGLLVYLGTENQFTLSF